MKFIYIASPYTLGDVAVNVKVSMDATNQLIDKGFYPFCPLLSHFLHMANPQPYKVWIEYTIAWMEKCEAIIRLSGESAGADLEEARAREIGLPVYRSVEEFFKHWL
jgi:hypothetical protein